MIYIDKYAYISALADVRPERKLILGLVALILSILSNRLIAFAVIFIFMVGLTVGKAKIPAKYYLKLMNLPFLFLLFSVLGIILDIAWTPTFQIRFSADAVSRAVYLVGKALAAVSCLYFIILTTPIRDIIGVLDQLRCPAILISLTLLIYRSIFLLMDVANIKLKSMQCRQAFQKPKGFFKAFGMLWGSVFVGSLRNSEWMYQAMLVRGYDGRFRFLPRDMSLEKKDIIVMITFIASIVALHALPPRGGLLWLR